MGRGRKITLVYRCSKVMASSLARNGFRVNGGKEAVDLSISALEMYPILLALLFFSSELKGKSLVIHTDDEALVYVFNNKSSKDPYISNM